MGKLGRFLKLERARPSAHATAPLEPAASGRFAKLEPRRDAPEDLAADPFMPPHERDVILEVAVDGAPDADRARTQNRARAEAELAEARERARLEELERDQTPPDLATQALDPVIRFTNTHRWYLLGGGSVAIALLAQIISPYVWILLPILVGVVIGSSFTARDA